MEIVVRMETLLYRKIKKHDIGNITALFIIALEFSAFLNIKLYEPLINLFPYINLFFILLGAVLLGSKVNKKDLLFLGICLLYVIPVSMINSNSMGAMIQYMSVFGTLYFFKNKQISEGFYKGIFFCCLFIFFYYTFNAWNAYEKFITDMLNHVNTNMIAFIVFYSYIIIYLFFNTRNYWTIRNICLAIMYIMAVCIIYAVKCRTTLIAILFWGVCNFIIPIKWWNSKKRVILLVTGIVLIGCIFPVLYVHLASNIELSLKVYNFTGKYLFTGREVIWKHMFDYMAENRLSLWIGIGSNSEYLFGQGYSLHNSYLGIILNYGIIGVALFMLNVILCISSAYEGEKISNRKKTLIISYVSFLLIGYSEVVIQVVDKVIMVNLLLGLACNKWEKRLLWNATCK